MYSKSFNYEYVSKSEYAPIKKELVEIVHELQDSVRDYFTIDFRFVGSANRNMITCDYSQNRGFDFDINLFPNDDDEEYSAQEIRELLFPRIREISRRKGYNKFENSTRVITIKKVDREHSYIEHSCDFAVVYNGKDGQQYIRLNKNVFPNTYTWEFQPKGYEGVDKKAEILRNGHLSEIKKIYLNKKNDIKNENKKSLALYVETINELWQKNS